MTLGSIVDSIEFAVLSILSPESQKEEYNELNRLYFKQPYRRVVVQGEIQDLDWGGSRESADALKQIRNWLPYPEFVLPQENQKPDKSNIF